MLQYQILFEILKKCENFQELNQSPYSLTISNQTTVLEKPYILEDEGKRFPLRVSDLAFSFLIVVATPLLIGVAVQDLVH